MYRLCAGLIVFLAALVFAARLTGRAQPLPLLPLITNPDGSACRLPCLFGIRPGETTTVEAVRILSRHPLTRNLFFDEEQMVFSGTDAAVFLDWRGAIVTAVGLTLIGPGFNQYARPQRELVAACSLASLGNVINVVGEPDTIGTTGSSAYFYTNYVSASMSFRHSARSSRGYRQIDPTGRFASVMVFAPTDDAQGYIWNFPSWRGFASLERYRRR
jgi:hypothetical protein